jgi:hypothetical protein
MKYRHLIAADLRDLKAQPRQELLSFIDEVQIKAHEQSPHSYTIVDDAGTVMFCGGVVEYWEGRYSAWAIFNKTRRQSFLAVHKTVQRFLREHSFRRIEAAVEVDFKKGHRWMRAMGFELETELAKAYLPSGKDASIYVRVECPK